MPTRNGLLRCFVLALFTLAPFRADAGQFKVAPLSYSNLDLFFGTSADVNGDGNLDIIAATSPNQIDVFLGNGDGTFQPPTSYAATGFPGAIVVGDVNNDGIPDLVTSIGDSKNVAVLLGLGNGTFGTAISFPAGGFGDHVVLADFNGDGKLDIAISYIVRNGVFSFGVLLGNGDGTFQSPTQVIAGGGPSLLAVGDLNHDGKPDVVTGNGLANNISLLLGNGDGTFQSPVTYPLFDGVAGSLLLADLDGDGNLDLAVGVEGKTSIEIFPGDGQGGLLFPHSANAGFRPFLFAAVDVNDDGRPDLLADDGTYLKVLLNVGGADFQLSRQYLQSAAGGGVAGDFNNDGNIDAEVVGIGLSFLAGTGNGDFPAAPLAYTTGAPSSSAAVADINRDGKLDIVAGSNALGRLGVLLGNGDGTFTSAGLFPAGPAPSSIVLADFNADGNLDAALTDINGAILTVVLGNGDGTFGSTSRYRVGLSPNPVVTADFNHDGDIDLATANFFSNDASVLLGNGDGTFMKAVAYSAGGNPAGIAVGDFNGDGNPDLAISNGDFYNSGKPGLVIRLGNGDGTFQPKLDSKTDKFPGSIAVADFNGDGNPDLIIATNLNLDIFLGNGDGTFRMFRQQSGETPHSIVVADFNGDGRLDVALLAFDLVFGSVIDLLLGNGDGTFQSPVTYPAGYNPTGLTMGDFNGDGAPDLAVCDGGGGGSVNILLNTGSTLSVPAHHPAP